MSQYRVTKAILAPINPAGIILLSIYTFVWGFWLANPWWDAFTRAAIYSKLDDFGTEYFWGLLAMAFAVGIAYGAFRPSNTTLRLSSGLGCIHWLMIAIFYFWGDWQNTGGITALTFATYAAYIHLNVKVNHLGQVEQGSKR